MKFDSDVHFFVFRLEIPILWKLDTYNQMQNIFEQSHFTPSPNSIAVFAQNWPVSIDNMAGGGFGLV